MNKRSPSRPPRHRGAVLREANKPLAPILLAAFSMLPFLRRPLGKDVVRPGSIIFLSLMLIVLPPIVRYVWYGFQRQVPPPAGHEALCGFALIYAIVALFICAKRWWGVRHGEEIHQRETGESWVASNLPINPELTEQLIVPLAVGLLGYGLKHVFSTELGLWLMWCGFSLFVLARWEHRSFWTAYHGMVDDRVRAQHYGDTSDTHDARRNSAMYR